MKHFRTFLVYTYDSKPLKNKITKKILQTAKGLKHKDKN
jgi:hypothetical protein